jgi:hypothetical protein
MTIQDLCKQAHKTAVEKGFWGCQPYFDDRNDGELIALMHSELEDK